MSHIDVTCKFETKLIESAEVHEFRMVFDLEGVFLDLRHAISLC